MTRALLFLSLLLAGCGEAAKSNMYLAAKCERLGYQYITTEYGSVICYRNDAHGHVWEYAASLSDEDAARP